MLLLRDIRVITRYGDLVQHSGQLLVIGVKSIVAYTHEILFGLVNSDLFTSYNYQLYVN